MTAYPRTDLIEAFVTCGYSPEGAAMAIDGLTNDSFWQLQLSKGQTALGAVNAYQDAVASLVEKGLMERVKVH